MTGIHTATRFIIRLLQDMRPISSTTRVRLKTAPTTFGPGTRTLFRADSGIFLPINLNTTQEGILAKLPMTSKYILKLLRKRQDTARYILSPAASAAILRRHISPNTDMTILKQTSCLPPQQRAMILSVRCLPEKLLQ